MARNIEANVDFSAIVSCQKTGRSGAKRYWRYEVKTEAEKTRCKKWKLFFTEVKTMKSAPFPVTPLKSHKEKKIK